MPPIDPSSAPEDPSDNDPDALNSDEELKHLLEQVGEDPAAFDKVTRKYQKPLLKYLHGQIPAEERSVLDTVDITQDAFRKTFEKLRSPSGFEYQGQAAFWGFLKKTGKNLLIDSYRRAGGRPKQDAIPEESAHHPQAVNPRPSELARESEVREVFESALKTLTEKQRKAFLAYKNKVPGTKVAQDHGFPNEDAMRVAVDRMQKKIREHMKKYAPE